MPSTSQLIQLHRRKRERFDHTSLRRAGFVWALVVSILILGIVFLLVFSYIKINENLPSLDNLPLLLNPDQGLFVKPTQFFDRTGTHVIYIHQNPAITERKYHLFESETTEAKNNQSFPKSLVNATIAISDPTFWSNSGFSFTGINDNSHNTIAQRLVSDLLLWDETPNLRRAIRERILAAQITSHFGREKIMEWYLNSANYGSFTYGADAAAQVYFGKSVSEINLTEAVFLAAISESPTLNPYSSPQATLERAEIVLDAMVGQGLITSKDADIAKEVNVLFQDPKEQQKFVSPQFIDMVWQQLPSSIPLEWAHRGGFNIITSLDYDLQTQTGCTIEVHLTRLKKEGEDQAENQNIFDSIEDCPASKLLPTLNFEPDRSYQFINTSVIVYEPSTSQIFAIVDRPGVANNSIHTEGRPPGTLITPFVYLTAFTRGFNPASLLWDIPLEPSPILLSQLVPETVYKGPLRLRNAFATDTLIPAARLINQVGIENIIKISRQMGLSSLTLDSTSGSFNTCPGCQILLGEGQVKLIEAIQAFGAFSNQGYLVGLPEAKTEAGDNSKLSPIVILSVVDNTNHIWLTSPISETRPVISNQLAYLMNNLLSDESARWPNLNHPNPLEIGRPTGAKIGTSITTTDLWTIGYTPQLAVGVWLGSDNDLGANQLSGSAASSLWHAIIQYALQDLPAESWIIPPGITTMDVCDPSGMLPTSECPNIVSEVFLSGQEPTQPDTLHQVYQVNRETGRLATVFTPPDLIDEHVYLNIPPEARSWAEDSGLETPPETYDPVPSPSLDPDVAIEYPDMFSYLSGSVTIDGRAAGSDFESYRLQAGKGINPNGWFVIKEETSIPVPSGVLGTWDTTGRNGLYAIQLILLRENQRVDSVTIQVTLDNEPPSVEINYPQNLAVLSAEEHEIITFLVDVKDNLGLNRVEYYLNEELVATQTQPPFAYPWDCTPGSVILTIKAIDNAGNATDSGISFTVE